MKKMILFTLFTALLIQAKTQERLIGTTAYGIDPLAKGMVFTMNTDGSNYSPKKEFMQSWGQGVDVVDGQDGYLYGIAAGNGLSSSKSAIFKISYDGSRYKTLYVFNNSTDGYAPRYRPVLHPNGYLYGICELGGTNNNGTMWRSCKRWNKFFCNQNFQPNNLM
ncbi:MAG: choice-of-anchor tandem repeat GloVer-containing protein [Chitinophagaceae bacterium]